MPTDHSDAALGEWNQQGLHDLGICTDQDESIWRGRQGVGTGLASAGGGPARVKYFDAPIQHLGSLLNALGNRQDTAIAQVFAEDGNGFTLRSRWAGLRTIPSRSASTRHSNLLLHVGK
jgi:hypothetical protein